VYNELELYVHLNEILKLQNIYGQTGGYIMGKVTKDMIIADILRLDRGTAPILLSIGMHCLGCPSSSGESLEDACAVHGVDVDKVVKELNDYLESKQG
jgi:hybrid cluster-associated redox disulfide protein